MRKNNEQVVDVICFDSTCPCHPDSRQARSARRNQRVNVLHPLFQYSSSLLAVMICLERAKGTLVVGNLVLNSEHINFNG
jgi:hypothetical protein